MMDIFTDESIFQIEGKDIIYLREFKNPSKFMPKHIIES
jgi:hypothetical protein